MRTALLLVIFLAVARAPLMAQGPYVNGIFVGTATGPVELFAFAERVSTGLLRMATGELEDVPTVEAVIGVLCSLPTWKPTALWVGSQALFRDEYAERRGLPFAVRQRNVYTVELRVADLEAPEGVARFTKAVRATADLPAYLFVTMQDNGGTTRHYPVRLSNGDR